MYFNYKYLFILGSISLLVSVLFVGQFYDHHGDKALFIKHRPTFHMSFYGSPRDEKQDEVKHSVNEDIEEKYFQEFIATRNIQKSSWPATRWPS